MFCSNCGKTIDATQDLCPHCGEKIGTSRMGGHTSAQSKYEPVVDQSQSGTKYAPYTKTTYTSNVGVGDDVYSRTTYRPVIVDSDQDAQKPEEPGEDKPALDEAPAAPAAATPPPSDIVKEPAPLNQVNRESLERLGSVPEDAPDSEEAKAILAKELDLKVKPVAPIKKTGISPEVEQYIKRVEAMKNRARKKRPDEAEEEQPAPDEQELPEDEDEGETEQEKKPASPKTSSTKSSAGRGKSRVWLGRVLVGALIVALIAGGVVYLAFMTQPKDQIQGVDNDLFKSGVALIKSHTTSDYRSNVIKAFRDDTSGQDAMKLQVQASDEIRKLMPDAPKENDEKFINTLLSIQESIDAATVTDALALLTKGDSSLSSLSADSAEQWDIINNYVTRLEGAKEPSELDIVAAGVADVMATPEPTPTPTPSAYKTLKKGDTNSRQVKNLQIRLFELGWFSGVRDGDYGSITQTAVKRFQQAAGLETTGIATPEVQEAIYAPDAVRTEENATPAPDDSLASVVGGGETPAAQP